VTCFSESRRSDIDVALASHGHDSLGLNSVLFAVLSVGSVTERTGNGKIYNQYMEFVFFFRCQNCALVDKTDLCKISKLVYGNKEILTYLYGIL
jgi:hypothetical protein